MLIPSTRGRETTEYVRNGRLNCGVLHLIGSLNDLVRVSSGKGGFL